MSLNNNTIAVDTLQPSDPHMVTQIIVNIGSDNVLLPVKDIWRSGTYLNETLFEFQKFPFH